METETAKTEGKQRRKWIEPKIETVNLVPKETVMGGCFSQSVHNAKDDADNGCGVPFPQCLA